MSLRTGPMLMRAIVVLGSIFVAAGALAQARVPPGGDGGASRVLEIERVLGSASIEREGRAIGMQPGFLLFSGERMTLSPRSRVDLRLLRYGDIDVMAVGDGAGMLSFEKLPFSSWAVDLATHIRLESGILRVRWARSGEADEWPMAVLVDRWKTQLTNGEFLFRRDVHGMVTCSVAGEVDLVDENANVREHLTPGHCLKFNRDGTTDRTSLAIAEWPELGVVLLREGIATPPAPERSLAMKSRPEATEPVVTPAPAAPPSRRELPPIPPRVPLAVAEESVRSQAADAAAGSGAADPVVPPPSAPEVGGDAEVMAAPAPASQRPLANEPPPPTTETSDGAAESSAAVQANAGAASAEGSAGDGPEWIVNVMTVTDPNVAQQHIARLTGAGYPATLRNEIVRGRASYRVIITGISNEQGARRTAQLLSSKMGYTGAWSLRKR